MASRFRFHTKRIDRTTLQVESGRGIGQDGFIRATLKSRRVVSYTATVGDDLEVFRVNPSKGARAALTEAKRWLRECVILKDDTFIQLLLLIEFANDAADRIYQAIVTSEDGHKRLKPILKPYDAIGSTRYVDFDTTRPVYSTNPTKCHISHAVADTDSWEQKMAQSLEDMSEVVCYAKNHNLGFTIPYTINGEEKNYIPDFIARIRDGGDEPLNLLIEVTGQKKKDKAAKVSTARAQWVPAVNNHGGFGRWAFLEITDPWDAKTTLRSALKTGGLIQ